MYAGSRRAARGAPGPGRTAVARRTPAGSRSRRAVGDVPGLGVGRLGVPPDRVVVEVETIHMVQPGSATTTVPYASASTPPSLEALTRTAISSPKPARSGRSSGTSTRTARSPAGTVRAPRTSDAEDGTTRLRSGDVETDLAVSHIRSIVTCSTWRACSGVPRQPFGRTDLGDGDGHELSPDVVVSGGPTLASACNAVDPDKGWQNHTRSKPALPCWAMDFAICGAWLAAA